MIEGVQYPSETIYMPHYINHAVYNLDNTVAVGDNPFFNTAIEESALELCRDGRNAYGQVKDFEIYLHKGALKIFTLLNDFQIYIIYIHVIENITILTFFILGFFTKRDLRRYSDVIGQIKKMPIHETNFKV